MESSNVSPNGLFIHTDLLFPVGEWLDLEFVMAGRAEPVRGFGRVVRVVDSAKGSGPGMAIHLPKISSYEKRAIRSFRSLLPEM